MAPANHQPKVAEHDVFARSPLPDGHGKGCGCATSPRRLVRHDRLEGRVLPRPRQSPLPPLPSPRLEEEVLRVSRSPIRPYLAPFVFTFVTKPLQAFLHARGIRTIFYLDDLLIIGSSQKECFAFLKIALQLLSRVGFVVDHKKSCLLPQQKFRFLGFDWNTFSSLLSISNTRRRSITARASKMILSASPRARDLQILLGRLTSVVPTIPLLRLHYDLSVGEGLLPSSSALGGSSSGPTLVSLFGVSPVRSSVHSTSLRGLFSGSFDGRIEPRAASLRWRTFDAKVAQYLGHSSSHVRFSFSPIDARSGSFRSLPHQKRTF